MKDIIISPPFGYWLTTDWATSVIGTFTLAERKGKWMQTLRTLRPTTGGWVNRIGLKNPGLNPKVFSRIKYLQQHQEIILSIHASNDGEWEDVFDALNYAGLTDVPLELNLSCPNVKAATISTHLLEMYRETFPIVIAKLPPSRPGLLLHRQGLEAGISYYHCSNTLATDAGGVSGTVLKGYSLQLIKEIRRIDEKSTIIGGGGIYTPADIQDYFDAGVDKFSLATIFFAPWKIRDVRRAITRVLAYGQAE